MVLTPLVVNVMANLFHTGLVWQCKFDGRSGRSAIGQMSMTLEEWKAADEATRMQFEAECYQRGVPRQIGELAEQAGKALAKELVNYPQVTAVASGEDNKARRSILLVTTSLGAGQKLPEVPGKYAGFPVVQVGVAERKQDYLRRLEFALRAANLPQDAIDHWSGRFDKELATLVAPIMWKHQVVGSRKR